MIIGIPKELTEFETRVALTPPGVHALCAEGHAVYVEKDAGYTAGYATEEYRQAGAEIMYSNESIYDKCELIVKVWAPMGDEISMLTRDHQTIMAFHHTAVAHRDLLQVIRDRKITTIAYETIQRGDGSLPVLIPTSQIAGKLAPIIAGQHLTTTSGGRGVLLGSIPGIPPATAVIIGGGVLGTSAARAVLGLGVHVVVIDKDATRLQQIDKLFDGRVVTMPALPSSISHAVSFADVVVGCLLVPGRRAPVVVTRSMVKTMRRGAVIIDFSIDQGGCCETSRPTIHQYPTYVEEGVIHYCVPNVPARVARTASNALNIAVLHYVMEIAAGGLERAFTRSPELIPGFNFYHGQLANPEVARSLDQKLEVTLPLH